MPFDKIKFVNEPVVNTTAATATGGMNKSATTTTTGAATATTTGSATTATAAKPNPWYPDHAVLSATKDQLKAMSAFKYATN